MFPPFDAPIEILQNGSVAVAYLNVFAPNYFIVCTGRGVRQIKYFSYAFICFLPVADLFLIKAFYERIFIGYRKNFPVFYRKNLVDKIRYVFYS